MITLFKFCLWVIFCILISPTKVGAQSYVYNTTGLPALVGSFYEGKFRVVVDQGSNTAQPIIVITPNVIVQLMYSDLTSGTTMQCSSYNGGTQQTANFASRPALNRWFYAWIAINSATTNGLVCGWMYADTAATNVYVTTQMDTPPTNPTGVYYGYRPNGAAYIEEDVADLRIYGSSFALIPNQIYWNRYNFVPLFPADLLAAWPMDGTTVAQALTDYSGKGHNLSYSGTPLINPAGGDPAVNQFGKQL